MTANPRVILMLHIVLEHDPAVADQWAIEEGFLTAQVARAYLRLMLKKAGIDKKISPP